MSASGTLASPIINVTIVEQIPVLRPVAQNFLGEQARELNRLVTLLRKKALCDLVLDLSACENISSEGLGMVSACWQWCHDMGKGCMGVVLPRDTENEVVNLVFNGVTQDVGVYNSTTGAPYITGTGSLRVLTLDADSDGMPDA